MIRKSKSIGGREMSIETGKIARQSNGSVLVSYGETTIHVAVNSAKEPREDIDFFPLQVEYREKHYAGGKIPGGFFKREARPSEHEVLTSRLTDRPIRPLFPKGFKNDTQVMYTVLQSDGENMADTLAGVGASAGLMLSSIPWNGPIASVRVGRVNGDYILNPTRSDQIDCDLDLIVSGNEETVVMVEGEAEESTESDVLEALKFAHKGIKEIIDLQKQLLSEIEVVKDEIALPEENDKLHREIETLLANQIDDVVKIKDKTERSTAKDSLINTILDKLGEKFPDEETSITAFINEKFKMGFREQVLATGQRSDGRKTTDIRPISVETGILSRTHGSALFTRGETQALVITTLGTKRDEQIVDSMDRIIKRIFIYIIISLLIVLERLGG